MELFGRQIIYFLGTGVSNNKVGILGQHCYIHIKDHVLLLPDAHQVCHVVHGGH